jgi:hypothetical protein
MMSDCPCCSGNLLRHIRPSGVYWYCLNCRREMPNLEESSHSSGHSSSHSSVQRQRQRQSAVPSSS